MTEYRWADLAEIASKEGKLGKIVATLCTFNQGQSGGGGVILTTDDLETTPKKKKR